MKKKLSTMLTNELAALQRHHLRMASMPSPKSLVKVEKQTPPSKEDAKRAKAAHRAAVKEHIELTRSQAHRDRYWAELSKPKGKPIIDPVKLQRAEKPCRHSHSWLMTNQQSGTGYEWCWQCGAIRGLVRMDGVNGYGVRTVWCRPGAKENPYEKWDNANKRMLEQRERKKK